VRITHLFLRIAHTDAKDAQKLKNSNDTHWTMNAAMLRDVARLLLADFRFEYRPHTANPDQDLCSVQCIIGTYWKEGHCIQFTHNKVVRLGKKDLLRDTVHYTSTNPEAKPLRFELYLSHTGDECEFSIQSTCMYSKPQRLRNKNEGKEKFLQMLHSALI
jgi:hypothetical protein